VINFYNLYSSENVIRVKIQGGCEGPNMQHVLKKREFHAKYRSEHVKGRDQSLGGLGCRLEDNIKMILDG
jgi:hypothetical protein